MFNFRQYYIYRQTRQVDTDSLQDDYYDIFTGNFGKVSSTLFNPIDIPIGKSLVTMHGTSFKDYLLQPGYRLVDINDPSQVFTVTGDPSPEFENGVYIYSFLAMRETVEPILSEEHLWLLTEDGLPILAEDGTTILVEGY